jgi:hypothetical protein
VVEKVSRLPERQSLQTVYGLLSSADSEAVDALSSLFPLRERRDWIIVFWMNG